MLSAAIGYLTLFRLLATTAGGAGSRSKAMQRTCEATAALFPRSLYCGIDLLVSPDFCDHAVLEVNAFGDLLPGITWNGLDSYTCELEALLERVALD